MAASVACVVLFALQAALALAECDSGAGCEGRCNCTAQSRSLQGAAVAFQPFTYPAGDDGEGTAAAAQCRATTAKLKPQPGGVVWSELPLLCLVGTPGADARHGLILGRADPRRTACPFRQLLCPHDAGQTAGSVDTAIKALLAGRDKLDETPQQPGSAMHHDADAGFLYQVSINAIVQVR